MTGAQKRALAGVSVQKCRLFGRWTLNARLRYVREKRLEAGTTSAAVDVEKEARHSRYKHRRPSNSKSSETWARTTNKCRNSSQVRYAGEIFFGHEGMAEISRLWDAPHLLRFALGHIEKKNRAASSASSAHLHHAIRIIIVNIIQYLIMLFSS